MESACEGLPSEDRCGRGHVVNRYIGHPWEEQEKCGSLGISSPEALEQQSSGKR